MHGDSTLTISLPSKWAKNNNLKKGQFLNMDISEKGLVIFPEKNIFEKVSITLSDDKEWYIHRILRQLYTTGFDEIRINYSKIEQISLIRKSIKNFIGLEIIESNFKYCILKSITSLENEKFVPSVKEVMWLINSQFNYFIEDCKNQRWSMLDEVTEIHLVVTKMIDLCRRIINKNILYGQNTSKYVFNMLNGLMNISRVIFYSYEYIQRKKELHLTKKELEFIIQVHELYSKAVNSYKNLSLNTTKDFLYERERISNACLEILNEQNPVIIHFFLDILKELSTISDLIMVLKTDMENKLE